MEGPRRWSEAKAQSGGEGFVFGASVLLTGLGSLKVIRGATGHASRIQSLLARYPEVIDIRTGRPIPFPSDIGHKLPKIARAPWGAQERNEFIKEWYRRGYETPRGGWSEYDIHHIKPREYGGTNDFWNLTPVARDTHKILNSFWNGFPGL